MMAHDVRYLSCAFWPFLCLLGEMSIHILFPFFSRVVFLLSCKCFFVCSVPYHTYDLQIFSPILWLYFHFLDGVL